MDTNWIPICSLIVSVIALVVSIIAVRYAKKQYFVQRKQYLSHLRPELWNNTWWAKPMEKQVGFDILNRSTNTAIITNVTPETENISLYQPFRRYELTNDESDVCKIVCNYHGTSIDTDKYRLKIEFFDKEGNAYSASIIKDEKGCRLE